MKTDTTTYTLEEMVKWLNFATKSPYKVSDDEMLCAIREYLETQIEENRK